MESDGGQSKSSSSSSLPKWSCQCGTRMASVKKDPHLKCSSCIGYLCEKTNRCDGCKDWPDKVFEDYVKYRTTLTIKCDSKSRAREKVKLGASGGSVQGEDSQQQGIGDSESQVQDQDGAGSSIQLDASIIDSKLAQFETKWESKFDQLQNRLWDSLHELFTSFSNQFIAGNPSRLPVDRLSGGRSTDPSNEEPQRESILGESEGAGAREYPSLYSPICPFPFYPLYQ